MTKRHTKRR